jgi:Fic family protein
MVDWTILSPTFLTAVVEWAGAVVTVLAMEGHARIFREGIGGFKGGLGAENFVSKTGTSHATATRDLQNLVEH